VTMADMSSQEQFQNVSEMHMNGYFTPEVLAAVMSLDHEIPLYRLPQKFYEWPERSEAEKATDKYFQN